MKSIYFLVLIAFSFKAYSVNEIRIKPELLEDQRKYSTKVIFDMIKHAKINNTNCNIKIRDGDSYFVIDEGTSKHGYTNLVEYGDDREVSHYDCILSKNKEKLECERGLPHNSNRQKGLTYIRLTINLDEKGYATSMHGNETTEYTLFSKRIPMLDTVNSKFSCDIQIPAKLKDPAIVNNGREESNFKDKDDGSLSSDTPSQISGKSTEK